MDNAASLDGPLSPEALGLDAFRRLAELAPDAMLAHRDGRVVWANRAAATLAGLDSEAGLLGKSVFDFVQPANRGQVASGIAASIATAQAARYAQAFVRPNGDLFEAELQRVPMAGGLILVIVRDLEARRREERERRSAELRARAFFDSTTEAMGISRLGIHVEANAAYALLFGFASPSELVGMPILALLDESEHARIRDFVGRRARGEVVPDSYSVRAKRRDGSTFLMAVKGSSYVDGNDNITIVVVRDVTAQREEDERLRHKEKLEAIGRLAGGVAHDFNNILAAVLGNAELALMTLPGDAQARGHLTNIREATKRARDLVRQILTFGRRSRSSATPLDFGAVVTDALGLARAGIPTTVALESRILPLGGTVLADATQLHQIVLNLCSNARDSVGLSGRVEVTVESIAAGAVPLEIGAKRCVRLRVKDNGAGMDDEMRSRVFEPYVTTKAMEGGHGLGLAVVHGIVTSLGGVIRVESAVGQGAAFDVFLPLSDELPVAAKAPPVAGGGSGRLLLVDDEPLIRQAVGRLLESLGYRVKTAADGADALAMLRASPGAFDLVISDISMPRVSGVDLARTLLAEQPAARIILCTGFSDGLDDASAKALGVKALLAKPILKDDLGEAVRAALGPAFVAPG